MTKKSVQNLNWRRTQQIDESPLWPFACAASCKQKWRCLKLLGTTWSHTWLPLISIWRAGAAWRRWPENAGQQFLRQKFELKLDSNCICNWMSSQHYSNARVTLTFDLWTPTNYTLVPFPKYYHWSKYEVPRCYGSKVRVDRTKVGRNMNKKNNNN